jgi:hypothetical protein
MRTPLAAVLAATALLALTACTTGETVEASDTPTVSQSDKDAALASAGIPPKVTGAERTALLTALRAIDPEIVDYEDKAVDAARNQCSAINSGSEKADWLASQRFSYRGNQVTEADGKLINQVLTEQKVCDLP